MNEGCFGNVDDGDEGGDVDEGVERFIDWLAPKRAKGARCAMHVAVRTMQGAQRTMHTAHCTMQDAQRTLQIYKLGRMHSHVGARSMRSVATIVHFDDIFHTHNLHIPQKLSFKPIT